MAGIDMVLAAVLEHAAGTDFRLSVTVGPTGSVRIHATVDRHHQGGNNSTSTVKGIESHTITGRIYGFEELDVTDHADRIALAAENFLSAIDAVRGAA